MRKYFVWFLSSFNFTSPSQIFEINLIFWDSIESAMVGSIQSSLKCIFHMIEYFGISMEIERWPKWIFFSWDKNKQKKFTSLIEFKKTMKNIFRFDWQKCFRPAKLTSIFFLSLIWANIYVFIKPVVSMMMMMIRMANKNNCNYPWNVCREIKKNLTSKF